MDNKESINSKELLSYYENEAEDVPIFGSLREISLTENILSQTPSFTNAIDIGCGEGYLLFRLSERKKERLYGLDLSEGRINTTKKYVPSASLLRGDVLSLPFPDNSFDIVFCSELLEHITDYKKVVDELIRISKRSIIITVPNELPLVSVMCPKCKTKHFLDGHVNFFTEHNLKAIFLNRNDVHICDVRKFHSIYTYNRITMKLPLFLRLFLDQNLLKLHKKISFLKPNFLMITLEKVNKKNKEI